jgi:hypothetical protein
MPETAMAEATVVMRKLFALPPNKQFQPTNSRCARICG